MEVVRKLENETETEEIRKVYGRKVERGMKIAEMHFVEEKSMAEIAKTVGMSRAAVYSRLVHIKKHRLDVGRAKLIEMGILKNEKEN